MEKKVTKKDMFERIMKEVNDQSIIDFCRHEIELLERKNKRTTPTKVQQENENLKKICLEELKELNKKVTIKDLQTLSTRLSANLYSNQKITSLVRQLVESELVNKVTEKGRTYYFVETSE